MDQEELLQERGVTEEDAWEATGVTRHKAARDLQNTCSISLCYMKNVQGECFFMHKNELMPICPNESVTKLGLINLINKGKHSKGLCCHSLETKTSCLFISTEAVSHSTQLAGILGSGEMHGETIKSLFRANVLMNIMAIQ